MLFVLVFLHFSVGPTGYVLVLKIISLLDFPKIALSLFVLIFSL